MQVTLWRSVGEGGNWLWKIFWKVLKLENYINQSFLLTVATQQIETDTQRKLANPAQSPAQEFL